MSRLLVAVFAFLFFARAVPAQIFQPVTCRNPYTQAQEIELGDKVVQQVYRTQPVMPDAGPLSQYVRSLGDRLVAAAPQTPGLEQRWSFRFHVVASEEINAFALPGGTMFVDLGAIQAAETEAQLAGVMAHEMAHVVLRHSTCNLAKKQKRSVWYSLGAIGSSVLLGGAAGDLAAQGIGAAQGLDFMRMSRGDEQQADLLGVQILHDAGFDPRGLSQFFEIIVAKYGRGGAQFLSDHPNPGNRTEYVNREIAQLSPIANPVKSTPAFVEAHALAAKQHALTAAELQQGTWRSSGLYAASPGAGPAPMPAGAAASPSGGNAPVAGSATVPLSGAATGAGQAPRLADDQLGINKPLTLYQGERFAIGRPANWAVVPVAAASGSPGTASVTLAPPGASGSFGLAYGVVLGWRAESVAVTDAGTLGAATAQIVNELTTVNGLTPEGASTSLTVAGQPALAQSFRGASPVQGSAAEHDWLVTVARPDGDLDTLLFVSPADQSSVLQPLFQRMLTSFRPQ